MPRKCYITHAWRPDREVKYIREAYYGYAVIHDPQYMLSQTQPGERIVPIDQIVFKDEEPWDDLL